MCISRARQESGCAWGKNAQRNRADFFGSSGTIDLRSLFEQETLGGLGLPLFKFLVLVSGEHAGTSLTDVDRSDVCPEAKAPRTQEIPVRANA